MPCVRHLPRCTDCSPRPYEEVHRALARRAAEEGIILLKNENHTLPLPSGCRIALYGTGALHTLKGGTGSGDVNARDRFHPRRPVRRRLSDRQRSLAAAL